MQQKQQKQRKQKKIQNWIWWVICLVLLIATGAATFAVWKVIKKDEAGQGEQPETVEVNEAVKVADEDETNEVTEENKERGGKKTIQYEGESPNQLDYLTGVITASSVSGDQLVIRTNIDQFLESGSCDLKIMRNNDIIYTDRSEIIASASTSTCYGFDVPVASIGTGNMQIVINLSSGEKTGTISGEASI